MDTYKTDTQELISVLMLALETCNKLVEASIENNTILADAIKTALHTDRAESRLVSIKEASRLLNNLDQNKIKKMVEGDPAINGGQPLLDAIIVQCGKGSSRKTCITLESIDRYIAKCMKEVDTGYHFNLQLQRKKHPIKVSMEEWEQLNKKKVK